MWAMTFNVELDALLMGGLVVLPQSTIRADIGIRDGRIAMISPSLTPHHARRVIDVSGAYVIPGVIDVHVHPVYLDDLHSTSVAAAFGGVTTLIHYAYARPGARLAPTLLSFRQEGLARSVLDFALHAGLFDVPNQIAELPAAFELGVTSFKVFMTYAKLKWMTDDYWLAALMDQVGRGQGLVMVHAENGLVTDYLEDVVLREGASPLETFGAVRPAILEAEAITRAIAIAQVFGCALYVVHVSAEDCLLPLRHARAQGWRVIGETCPQYLVLTDDTTARLRARAKIAPPLRTRRDNEALWRALADGTLAVIASDHAPKPKDVDDPFFEASYGAPQIETMLPLVYHYGVNQGHISLQRLTQVLSETPARIFGLYPQKGTLRTGADADLVVVDADQVQILANSTQHTAARYTLYDNCEILGAPIRTMQRGEIVVRDGELLGEPGHAQFLRTNTSHLYRAPLSTLGPIRWPSEIGETPGGDL
jgi:dihydropyrimidinase